LELLEQRAQRNRRAACAVAQQRHRLVARGADIPLDDGRALRPGLAALPALAAFAFLAALCARPGLPAGAGTRPGIILARDEPRRIERYDVALLISLGGVVGVADSE
jgi:hypothetical protein